MNEIRITMRPRPRIIDFDNNFKEIKRNLKEPTFWTRLLLLFVSFSKVVNPSPTRKELCECGCTDGAGHPLYYYKQYKGHIYQLQFAPSPGFPGS